jgi:hypothetical protein
MRIALRLVLGLALIMGLASGVQAGPVTITFDFTAGANTGSASLLADVLGGGQYGVYSGTLHMTGGVVPGDYDLYPNPDPYNVSILWVGGLGYFQFDNLVTFPGSPMVDTNGLLFYNPGSGNPYPEINIYSAGTGYGFIAVNDTAGILTSTTFTAFDNVTVPDGGTTLMLLGCALTSLGLLRRKFRG